MEQRFKQRLMGAVVLVALAVIFLPMLLSGPVERTRVDIELDMPPEPPVDAAPTLPTADQFTDERPEAALANQPPPTNIDQAADEPNVAQTLEVRPEAEPETAPAPEVEPSPEPAPSDSAPGPSTAGFYVQVGAFGSAENAERLAAQLRDDDFSVRVIDESGAHRVQVGPIDSRERAERMTQRLAEGYELPGFIIEP